MADPIRRATLLAQFLKTQNVHTGIEYGTRKGDGTKVLLELVPLTSLITIDSWLPDHHHDENTQDQHKAQAVALRLQYPQLSVWQMDALAAAIILQQHPADFVYLDVTYNSQWLARHLPVIRTNVKHGGIIAGSGKHRCKVMDVVNQNVHKYGGQINKASYGSLWIWTA